MMAAVVVVVVMVWLARSVSRLVGAGAIPPEFGKLKKLQRFNAGHNIGLSGGWVGFV